MALTDPNHIAIIMDGNGRWAKTRGLPRLAGHRAGMATLRKVIKHIGEKTDINWLTVYAFSSENWSRPEDEVSGLLSLLKLFVTTDLDRLHKNNVRIHVIGNRDNLQSDIEKLLNLAVSKTANNSGLNLAIAFNYGGRDEIIRATRKIASDVRSGEIAIDAIDIKLMSSYLDSAAMPDPDLVIRTSGEMRLSNFYLWQIAYAELYFTPKLWPDIEVEDVEIALADYRLRERRYGALKQKQ